MECGGSARLGGGQEEAGIAKPVVGSSWCQLGAEGQRVRGRGEDPEPGLPWLSLGCSVLLHAVLLLPYWSSLTSQGQRAFAQKRTTMPRGGEIVLGKATL